MQARTWHIQVCGEICVEVCGGRGRDRKLPPSHFRLSLFHQGMGYLDVDGMMNDDLILPQQPAYFARHIICARDWTSRARIYTLCPITPTSERGVSLIFKVLNLLNFQIFRVDPTRNSRDCKASKTSRKTTSIMDKVKEIL